MKKIYLLKKVIIKRKILRRNRAAVILKDLINLHKKAENTHTLKELLKVKKLLSLKI